MRSHAIVLELPMSRGDFSVIRQHYIIPLSKSLIWSSFALSSIPLAYSSCDAALSSVKECSTSNLCLKGFSEILQLLFLNAEIMTPGVKTLIMEPVLLK